MKKHQCLGFVLGSIVMVGVFAGCFPPNNCSDTNCNDGECVQGDCICDSGYEGLDCTQQLNEKFMGVYTCNETCDPTGAAPSYSVFASPKSSATDCAYLRGLWEVSAAQISAYIGNDGGSFSIPRQSLMKGYEIEADAGSITADGSSITLTYRIFETLGGNLADQCTATLTK